MTLRKLLEGSQVLNASIRRKMNVDIQKLLKPTYFHSIPLSDIFDILEKYGIVALQEDDTKWSGFLLGGVSRTEQVNFTLGFMNTKYDLHGLDTYQQVKNAMLVLTYYKMGSGKYEVIAYIS